MADITINKKGVLGSAAWRMQQQSEQAKALGLPDPYRRKKKKKKKTTLREAHKAGK